MRFLAIQSSPVQVEIWPRSLLGGPLHDVAKKDDHPFISHEKA
jgi:hypothetical protein